jgi:hypothetical protein
VPGEEVRLSGIDLDECYRDGALDERAAKILLAADSYAERSPSGEGLHILGFGDIGTLKIPPANNAPGVELYSHGRYFTVTGQRLNGAELADITEGASFARKLMASSSVATTSPKPTAKAHAIGAGGRNTYLSGEAFRLRKQGAGAEQILAVLQALNDARCEPPLAEKELELIARGKQYIEPDTPPADWCPPRVVTYGADFDAAKIPRRRWLLGRRRSIGDLTVDVGPPGVNKSTLLLTDAVAIATGRKIIADEVYETGAVRFLAGEDARRDVEARLAGILTRHGIAPAELAGRLQIVYLTEHDATTYCLAQMVDDLAVLNTSMLEWLRRERGIIATFLDPILAWHRLLENSNEAMQVLSSSLRSLAVRTQQHIGFDHHVTKVAQADSEAHVGKLAAVRGGGSLAADARWVYTLARLKPETAEAYGVPETERTRYRRLDPLKASYGPDDDDLRLLRVESVPIANGEQVGVLVEVDIERTREDAIVRRARAAEEERARLGMALATMLGQKGPSSVRATTLWLMTHHPSLFHDRKGKPLSDTSIRTRLPGLIGSGLPVARGGRQERIVLREGVGKRGADEIGFEQDDLPIATGQTTGQ